MKLNRILDSTNLWTLTVTTESSGFLRSLMKAKTPGVQLRSLRVWIERIIPSRLSSRQCVAMALHMDLSTKLRNKMTVRNRCTMILTACSIRNIHLAALLRPWHSVDVSRTSLSHCWRRDWSKEASQWATLTIPGTKQGRLCTRLSLILMHWWKPRNRSDRRLYRTTSACTSIKKFQSWIINTLTWSEWITSRKEPPLPLWIVTLSLVWQTTPNQARCHR